MKPDDIDLDWAFRVWQKLWRNKEDFIEMDEGVPYLIDKSVPRLIPDLWREKKEPIMVREVYHDFAQVSGIATASESDFNSLIIWGQPGIGNKYPMVSTWSNFC